MLYADEYGDRDTRRQTMADFDKNGRILCARVDCDTPATHIKRTFGYNEHFCPKHGHDWSDPPEYNHCNGSDPVLQNSRYRIG